MVSLIFLKNKIRNNEHVFKKTHGQFRCISLYICEYKCVYTLTHIHIYEDRCTEIYIYTHIYIPNDILKESCQNHNKS